MERRRGNLLFQKPLLIRWQTAKPHEETLVTAKEIWDYLPDEEVAYRYPPSLVRDSRSIIQVITGQAAPAPGDFDVSSPRQRTRSCQVAPTPRNPLRRWWRPNLGGTGQWLHQRRPSIVDFYGNTNEVRFTSFKPDVRLKASVSSFTAQL